MTEALIMFALIPELERAQGCPSCGGDHGCMGWSRDEGCRFAGAVELHSIYPG